MTRKRFIKLLMAKGNSRNAAAHFAASLQGRMPYKEGYDIHVTMGNITAIVGTTLCAASRVMIKVSVTTAEASAAFKALAKEMGAMGKVTTMEEKEDPT